MASLGVVRSIAGEINVEGTLELKACEVELPRFGGRI
jgi:hypothetical protein